MNRGGRDFEAEAARSPQIVSVRVRLERLGMWPTVERISREHYISPDIAISRDRHASASRARHHIWAVIRWTLGMPYHDIACIFDVDHTSIINGVDRWDRELERTL